MILLFLSSFPSSFLFLPPFSRMQIITVTLNQFYYNFNQIEKMSKPLLGLQQFNSPKNNATIGANQKRERLMKIEQKLQAITVHRQNQVKDEGEEELTRRVLEIQLKCTEQIKSMETKVRELKETLAEMKLRQGEMAKKCELSKRTRMAQIKNLQKKLANFMVFESKQRKDMEMSVISILERRDKQLLSQLASIKEARIEALNKFQDGLQEQIPELNYSIQAKLQETQVNLECLHQKIRNQVEQLKEKIQSQEAAREKGRKSVMELIAKLTHQIKTDLEAQKKQREESRLKLMALFQSAYGKLRLL